jgi:hypothetical protein
MPLRDGPMDKPKLLKFFAEISFTGLLHPEFTPIIPTRSGKANLDYS